MKFLAIVHDAADPPGAVGTELVQRGHSIDLVELHRDAEIPADVTTDALLTFGGGISLALDDNPPAWVQQEQELIRRYIDAGKHVFGICLGSQMIAAAMGAEVTRNREPEVGWLPVQNACGESWVDEVFTPPFCAFQWHRDTFAIPSGARRLMSSHATENQAYVYDDRVFGFQFHLEATERTVRTFIYVSNLWKKDAPFIQDEAEIKAGIKDHLPNQAQSLKRLLDQVLEW